MSEPGSPPPPVLVTIPMDMTPRWLAITPDGLRAYVAVDRGGPGGDLSSGVSVIDTANKSVTTTIRLGTTAGGPSGVAITPDGRHAYVPLFDTEMGSGVVRVIDTERDSVITTVTLSGPGGGPSGIAITPDGRHAYVGTSHERGDDRGIVSVIEIATNTVIDRVRVNPFPSGMAISPDGRHVWVLDQDGSPAVIDTASHEAAFPIEGLGPGRIAFTPDGRQAYVTHDEFFVDVVDTTTKNIATIIDVDGRATDVAVTPDGGNAYVTQRSGGNISVIDTATNQLTGPPIRWSGSANAVGITPDGLRAFVADRRSEAVVVLRISPF